MDAIIPTDNLKIPLLHWLMQPSQAQGGNSGIISHNFFMDSVMRSQTGANGGC